MKKSGKNILFVLGIAAVGFAVRRRTHKQTVQKVKLPTPKKQDTASDPS